MKRLQKGSCILVLLLLFFWLISMSAMAEDKSEQKTVRVGGMKILIISQGKMENEAAMAMNMNRL